MQRCNHDSSAQRYHCERACKRECIKNYEPKKEKTMQIEMDVKIVWIGNEQVDTQWSRTDFKAKTIETYPQELNFQCFGKISEVFRKHHQLGYEVRVNFEIKGKGNYNNLQVFDIYNL